MHENSSCGIRRISYSYDMANANETLLAAGITPCIQMFPARAAHPRNPRMPKHFVWRAFKDGAFHEHTTRGPVLTETDVASIIAAFGYGTNTSSVIGVAL